MQTWKLAVGVVGAAMGVATEMAFATDGMNMEGYGPEALGVGGASLAWDNGTAAVINNPATLGLAPDGQDRLDVALGYLGPDVKVSVPGGGPSVTSDGKAYFMPAVGWSRRAGDWTYGLGVFGQGGMGTDYPATSFLALNSGGDVGSELSVGRVIAPLAYRLNKRLIVAGSLDLVWAGLDLQMAIPAPVAPTLMTGGSMALPPQADSDYVRIAFADGSPLTGEAQGYGAAGKVGLVFQAHERVTLGAVYHSETALSDLESDHATLSFGSSATGVEAGRIGGKATIEDFQWPATIGAGIAIQAAARLSLFADVKHIGWAAVMEQFRLVFDGGAAGDIRMALPQDWDDEWVVAAGAALQVTDNLVLRLGYHHTDNPIPNALVNPLFPAIVEEHYTTGFTYTFGANAIGVAASYAPDSKVTNGDGLAISHSQLNGQLMFTRRF